MNWHKTKSGVDKGRQRQIDSDFSWEIGGWGCDGWIERRKTNSMEDTKPAMLHVREVTAEDCNTHLYTIFWSDQKLNSGGEPNRPL